ncbi:hypothetical protein HAZT_HAZT009690 [Hyalella azteca]|uniref:EF-hand domain-containing protein n=1 Tax=Hyalella azteca TaxID=294128 RepID=A0A6A0GTT6_HYAAZ|nr:hypothetical protein HAZT_HAZT009690 [Hyalella azteca]
MFSKLSNSNISNNNINSKMLQEYHLNSISNSKFLTNSNSSFSNLLNSSFNSQLLIYHSNNNSTCSNNNSTCSNNHTILTINKWYFMCHMNAHLFGHAQAILLLEQVTIVIGKKYACSKHGQRMLHKQSLSGERDHIKDHLEVPLDTSGMSEQELQFHYFKMHDADNNNKLDGQELIKSLFHWHDADNHDPSKVGCGVSDMKTKTRCGVSNVKTVKDEMWCLKCEDC